jgi:serine/threonine protein kinase
VSKIATFRAYAIPMSERVVAGRYRLDQPLGLGGMSSVWEAEDVELERRVAVKVLAGTADRQRFEREARAAAALSHPNVVQIFDFGESEDGPYIVLELLPGGTLEERLPAREPLPDAETARIALGIAEGLAYVHAHGLVHRDLKPANVLFDLEDRPKLSDFGIARIAGDGTLTEPGTVLGTAAYISPEQASGEVATPASDVYSFGVILYRMLTGRLPFEGDEPLAVAAMHVHDEPAPIASLRPDAPARLESVATAALAKDPEDRPADGAALVAELSGIAVFGAPRRRRAVVVALAGVATVLLATAGIGVALVASGEGNPGPLVATTAPSTPSTTTETETTEPAAEPPTTEKRETATAETETELPPPTTEPLPTETIPTETLPTETVPTETQSVPPTTTG